MNELIVGVSLIFITFCGYLVLRWFDFVKDYSFFEKLPYSFGLGTGMIAFQLFNYSKISIPFRPEYIIGPWIMLAMYLFFKRGRKIKADLKFNKKIKLSLVQKILLLFILITVVYTGFEVWLRPLYAWDGWAIWLIKAKVFYLDGFVNPLVYHLLRDSYPYVINLAATFLYIVLGKVDDRAVLLLFFAFYLFLGIAFYNFARNQFGVTKALLFTFLLLSTQNIIRHGGRFEAGYADLALGFYIFLSVTLLISYFKNNTTKSLILLSVFLGITGLIKQEGMVFGFFVELLLFYKLVIKGKKIKDFFIASAWLLIILDWTIFKLQHAINYSLYESLIPHFDRIPRIIYEILREFLNVQNWNILWPIFILSIPFIFFQKKKNEAAVIVFMLVVLQIFSYILVFMVSPHDPALHVKNVMNRLLLHIAPLAVYLIMYAVSINSDFKKK